VPQETAILELIAIAMGHAWSLLQWWANISFGLIALTHFGAARLNRLLVVTLVILYTLFTVFWLLNHLALVAELLGHVADLRTLQKSQVLGEAAMAKLDLFESWRGIGSAVIVLLCVLGTYVGTTTYVLHTFLKSQTKESK
jgi:hypothetical protein